MEVVWFVETIAEVTKDDRISRKGAAMFEKIALLFKEEVVRQFVLFDSKADDKGSSSAWFFEGGSA